MAEKMNQKWMVESFINCQKRLPSLVPIILIAVPEELRLGCYRSNVGGTGRFAKGVLNDCKVYNCVRSDEEMNALLLE